MPKNLRVYYEMYSNLIFFRYIMSAEVFLILICLCVCTESFKYKRKVDNLSDKTFSNSENNNVISVSNKEKSRGFFSGGLFSIGKVLNFFPVGGERECQPAGHTLARAGICLNPYDCRQRDGNAAGDCAHGLGVCCVFEVTCGATVQNNLTYFMSPGFPELWVGERDCTINVEKTHAGIMQLRIDFVHFTIGQPNRTTGECDEDAMILGEGSSNFTICGQNHGHHVYYTLPSGSETREAGDLPSTKSTRLTIRMRGSDMPRLWMLRLSQMPLAQSAPHNCLQYFTDNNGTIKTFNYAVNGRHLAGQEYRACVRRNTHFCSIRYWPCDPRSFRIGASDSRPPIIDPADNPQMEEMMPINDQTQDDTIEGSGDDPQLDAAGSSTPSPSLASRIWSFIWPSWMWGQSRTWSWSKWSPYAQHYANPDDDKFRYYGYGNYGVGFNGYGRQRCTDRITIPCDNEYFVASSLVSPGVCDPHHCGSTFCPGLPFSQCKVDSSITPFAVSVHFGPPTYKRSPEENIGACLRYSQVPCNS